MLGHVCGASCCHSVDFVEGKALLRVAEKINVWRPSLIPSSLSDLVRLDLHWQGYRRNLWVFESLIISAPGKHRQIKHVRKQNVN